MRITPNPAISRLALNLAFTACLLIAFYLITRQQWPISQWAPGTSARYCELVSDGSIREVSNTWSNLGFVIAGVLIFIMGTLDRISKRPQINPMIGQGLVPTLFGLSLVAQGFGSGLFHAIQTPWAGITDNMVMMSVIAVPLAYNLCRIHGWGTRHFIGLYVLFFGGTCGAVAINDNLGTTLGDLMTLAAILSEVLVVLPALRPWSRRFISRRQDLIYWLGFMGIGFSSRVVWALSKKNGPLCDPQSIFQGHAIWHVACAIGVFSYYFYCRSEGQRSS